MSEQKVIIEFLRYCLDDKTILPDSVNIIDWNRMLVWVERQSIVGIIYTGIQKADKSLKIPTEILFKWIAYTNLIEGRNRQLNIQCVKLTEYLGQFGFDSCILKGQGNSLMYPNPLWRTSGDIDVWVTPQLKIDNGKLTIKEIIRYVKARNPKGRALYHHIDLGEINGVEVEVHYRPSFMFNPINNRRLQKWFCKMADGGCMTAELPDGVGMIPVPNREFNVVFQLSHIYNHVLHEGIGLRQIVDYYFLLKSEKNNQLQIDNGQLRITLRYLGLENIAGAMMWVLHEALGMEKEYLIVPEDEKRGRVLLQEIMRGGNFGQYNLENIKANNQFKKNIQRLKRDMKMVRYFPSECLWEPVFRIYHFFWRLKYN